MRRRDVLVLTPLAVASVAAGPPPVQQGLASFYGKGFHGKETSTGETFDQTKLTAAHPTYPGGTILRVTNLRNSLSISVRVNDRGPAKWVRREGVIIDLSRAAAQQLAITEDGRAMVCVELIRKAG
jgi:rare lipoprotein A